MYIPLPEALEQLNVWLVPQWGVKDGVCKCKQGPDCTHPGKHPKYSGYQQARQNIEEGDNVALLCGEPSQVVAIDIDRKSDGPETLSILEKGLGALPATLQSKTQDGGEHRIFAYADIGGYNGRIPGVEFKGNGSLITIPPSAGVKGLYTWGKDLPLAALPEDWIKVASGIKEGERNNFLTHVAGRYYRAIGQDPAKAKELKEFLSIVNRACIPSISDLEIQSIVNSITKRATPLKVISSNKKPAPTEEDAGITEHYVAENIVLPNVARQYRFSPGLGWLRFDSCKMVQEKPFPIFNEFASYYSNLPGKKNTKIYRILGNDRTRKGLLNVLETFDCFKYTPENDPFHIHTPTGILNLKTKEMTPITIDNASIHVTEAKYLPGMDYTRESSKEDSPYLYLKHMHDLLPSPYEVDWLNRYVLYVMSGLTHFHVLTILKGSGANGKTTWVTAITNMLGSYAKPTPRDIVINNNREIEKSYARLEGVRLSYLNEPPKGAIFNDGIMKHFASPEGLQVDAKKLYKDPYLIKLEAKLLVDTNNFFFTRDNTLGMWRRIFIIPWTKRVDNKDIYFKEKLYKIKDHIFTYLVNQEFPTELEPTKIMISEAKEEKKLNDPVSSFLAEQCEIRDGVEDKDVDTIYAYYLHWAQAVSEKPLPKRIFARELRHTFPDEYYTDGKREYFKRLVVERPRTVAVI